jgi:hypothetical protein
MLLVLILFYRRQFRELGYTVVGIPTRCASFVFLSGRVAHCPKILETKIMLLELMLYRMYTCVLLDIKKTFTPCTRIYCAAFELKHFTPNSKKMYVLFEPPLSPTHYTFFQYNFTLCLLTN